VKDGWGNLAVVYPQQSPDPGWLASANPISLCMVGFLKKSKEIDRLIHLVTFTKVIERQSLFFGALDLHLPMTSITDFRLNIGVDPRPALPISRLRGAP
jgi:hypothetical protein